jgi:hypothetical protein
MLPLTEAQIQEIALRVRSIIRAESKNVGEVPQVETLAGVTSLPALRYNGGIPEVVRAPISVLGQPAVDAANEANAAAANANTAAAGANMAKDAANAAASNANQAADNANDAGNTAMQAAANAIIAANNANQAASEANTTAEAANEAATGAAEAKDAANQAANEALEATQAANSAAEAANTAAASVNEAKEAATQAATEANEAAASVNEAKAAAIQAATDANTATDAANQAASEANTAAEAANEAATGAAEAMDAANQAASEAQEATQEANSAAEAANTAAASVNEAGEAAIQAATNADAAADAANQAAQAANTATEIANEAATGAAEAKDAANQAASEAQVAAQEANNAAEAANTAAGDAQNAIEAANAAAEAANEAKDAANQATSEAQTAAGIALSAASAAGMAAAEATESENAATQAANTANDAASNANTAAARAELLNSHQPVQQINSDGVLTWWVFDPEQGEYVDTTLPARGPEGRGPIVLDNGNYGNWDETAQEYVDSGVETSVNLNNLDGISISFQEAEQRENVDSGDNLPALFGKIRKWLADLGALAWKNKVDYNSDINNLPDIPPEQIPSDWLQEDAEQRDFIKNKPSIPAKTSDLANDSHFVSDPAYVHSDASFTAAEKDKLEGIDPHADVSEQADWNEASTASKAFIKNKPDIPTRTSDIINDTGLQSAIQVANTLASHNTSEAAHSDIRNELSAVEAIARGKSRAFIFDTRSDLDDWILIPDNRTGLAAGDNLYIRQTDVPDYWWDGAQIQPLENEKVDLSVFYDREQSNARFSLKPVQKATVLPPDQWIKDNDLWTLQITDADIADGCFIEAWPVDREASEAASSAEVCENIIISDGTFSLTAGLRPTQPLNIIYTIIK